MFSRNSLFLINYANSALSALKNAQTPNGHLKYQNIPVVIPQDPHAGGIHPSRTHPTRPATVHGRVHGRFTRPIVCNLNTPNFSLEYALLHFQLKMQQKSFGRRAPPGPAGGAY